MAPHRNTGSNGSPSNDRSSLLRNAEVGFVFVEAQEPAPPPQPQARVAASAPAASVVPDIEAATRPLAPSASAPDGHMSQEPAAAQEDAESKRVAKIVHTVCLFVASASLVLFVKLPSSSSSSDPSKVGAASASASGEGHGALYSADLAFIGLGFLSSLALSMFSIVARPGEAAVARMQLQKWGMMVALVSLIVAFALRMRMCMMPVA